MAQQWWNPVIFMALELHECVLITFVVMTCYLISHWHGQAPFKIFQHKAPSVFYVLSDHVWSWRRLPVSWRSIKFSMDKFCENAQFWWKGYAYSDKFFSKLFSNFQLWVIKSPGKVCQNITCETKKIFPKWCLCTKLADFLLGVPSRGFFVRPGMLCVAR